MKVAHFADTHFQEGPVLKDIQKCCDFGVETCIKESPDLIVIAGDLWNSGVQLGSPASLAGISFVKRLGDIAPTVIISGTTSHDAPGSIVALKDLRTLYPVYVTDTPHQVAYSKDIGFVPLGLSGMAVFDPCYRNGDGMVLLSLLPTITKANLMASITGSIADTSRQTVDLVRDMLQGWGIINEQARAAGIPTVLVGHGTVTGSILSTGQTMAGKDMEYTTGDLMLAKCDLYCLGHIHKRQEWNGNIFYSGSITRLNQGEQEEKGLYVHIIEKDYMAHDFFETPARIMKTLSPEGLPGVEIAEDVQEGDIVRIVYDVAEADVGKVDKQALIDAAMAKGAASVKIEANIIPTVRVRAEGISREQDIYKKLEKWGATTDTAITEEIAKKLAALEVGQVEALIEELYGRMTDETIKIAA
jgi:exonuclease SbcD